MLIDYIDAARNRHIRSSKAIALVLARRTGSKPREHIMLQDTGNTLVRFRLLDPNFWRDCSHNSRRVLDNFILDNVSGPKTALIFGPITMATREGQPISKAGKSPNSQESPCRTAVPCKSARVKAHGVKSSSST